MLKNIDRLTLKKILYKRTADSLEKLGVGSALVGLFKHNLWGYLVAAICFLGSYYFSLKEAQL